MSHNNISKCILCSAGAKLLIVVLTWGPLLISPSYCYRLGCAVTGYQGDESRNVGVLQRGQAALSKSTPQKHWFNYVFIKLTRMMIRIAETPEVAMTLAQLGMRLNRTGTMASAPWSNLFPSTDERWLWGDTGECSDDETKHEPSSSCCSAIVFAIYISQHSRHSDTGLSDHLWAQVFSGQFESSI